MLCQLKNIHLNRNLTKFFKKQKPSDSLVSPGLISNESNLVSGLKLIKHFKSMREDLSCYFII